MSVQPAAPVVKTVQDALHGEEGLIRFEGVIYRGDIEQSMMDNAIWVTDYASDDEVLVVVSQHSAEKWYEYIMETQNTYDKYTALAERHEEKDEPVPDWIQRVLNRIDVDEDGEVYGMAVIVGLIVHEPLAGVRYHDEDRLIECKAAPEKYNVVRTFGRADSVFHDNEFYQMFPEFSPPDNTVADTDVVDAESEGSEGSEDEAEAALAE